MTNNVKLRIIYPYSSKQVHVTQTENEGFQKCCDELKSKSEFCGHIVLKVINMTTSKIYTLKIKNSTNKTYVNDTILLLKTIEYKIDKLTEKINNLSVNKTNNITEQQNVIEYPNAVIQYPNNVINEQKIDDKICVIM